MKKKKLKLLVVPIAVASASVIGMVSGTLAYFTSVDKATVSIEAGQVNIDLTVLEETIKTYSLGELQAAGKFENGGTAVLNGNTLSLNLVTPGDKVVFDVKVKNKSNVDIKYRLTNMWENEVQGADPKHPELKGYLHEVLNVSAKVGAQDISAVFAPWDYSATASEMEKIMTVTIEFPVGDDTDNRFQNARADIKFGVDAVQKNMDTYLLDLNAPLEQSLGQNATMYDALLETGKTATEIASKNVIWDSELDRFLYLPASAPLNAYNYFKVYSEMPVTSEGYSIYANWADGVSTINLDGVGFDAGDSEGITQINYVDTGAAKTVVLRSNATTTNLRLDAALDSVKHYGDVGVVETIAIAGNSYHEFGKASFIEVKTGRIVFEEDSDVDIVYLAKTNDAFNNISLKVADGASLPDIQRDSVGLDLGNNLLKVCVVETAEKTETIYLTGNGTIEDEKVYVSETGDVADATYVTEESASDAAVQIANAKVEGDAVDTGLSEAERAEEIATIIQDNIDHVDYKGDVLIHKDDESVEDYYLTLAAFRDAVNEGNSFAGYTITQQANVDLNNAAWTPIGTNANPFSGKYDGNGRTVSNFNVSSTSKDVGLFGVIRGLDSSSFKRTFSDLWDSSAVALKDGVDSEEPFSTVVKDLTIKNANVVTTESYAGALAGYTVDAYLSNIRVKSGYVSATKSKSGGITGSSNGCSVLKGLITGSDLTVEGQKHTIGGISGSIQRSYTDSDHAAVVRENEQHAVLVENCINNAAVNWTGSGTTGGSHPIGGIVGNAGSCGTLEAIFYNCTNNGSITANTCDLACGIVGQSHSPVKMIYGCVNNGTITADAQMAVAGICYYGSCPVIACSNTGVLTNTKSGGLVFDITSTYNNISIEGETYADVEALAADINGRNNSTCRNVSLKNVTVIDNSGVLVLPENIESITSNTKVCDSVSLSGNLSSINLIGITQEVATTRSLTFSGSNNIITVPENAVAGRIALKGTNNSFTNNGVMDTLSYSSAGVITAVNNGTMKGLGSAGVGAELFTFTNYGTLSRNDWHTIDVECDGNLIIHNYGSIINTGTGSLHALLFYSTCNVTYYAHADSVVSGMFAPYSTTHEVQIYYAEGTTMSGRSWPSLASSQYHVTVTLLEE